MIKTGKELAAACVNVAKNYKTLYVMGCFGWPMNDYNKQRAKAEYVYNSNKAAKIDAASADTFGFDCVNLIKALLWGWNGDVNAPYGGVVYQSNGVPDINDDMMIKECKDVSTDFKTIQVGEVVWMQGHIGVYVGDGLVVECTPIWEDGVQVTVLLNKGWQQGNGRYWTSHGKLPWVSYEEMPVAEPEHWYRIRKSWDDPASQIAANKNLEQIKAGCPEGYSVFDWNGNCVYYNGGGEFVTDTSSLEEFVRDIQKACGAAVDGIAGAETLRKTVTLSAKFNATHGAVKPVQERLWALGYQEVGEADGEAGPKFTSAVAHFQQDNDCAPTGIMEEWGKTWHKLLGVTE